MVGNVSGVFRVVFSDSSDSVIGNHDPSGDYFGGFQVRSFFAAVDGLEVRGSGGMVQRGGGRVRQRMVTMGLWRGGSFHNGWRATDEYAHGALVSVVKLVDDESPAAILERHWFPRNMGLGIKRVMEDQRKRQERKIKRLYDAELARPLTPEPRTADE